jgi:hypothetical protein
VLDAFRRFSILKLENTYLALSIPEIGERTSPDPADHAETEAYVVSLMSSGYLNATFHGRTMGRSLPFFVSPQPPPKIHSCNRKRRNTQSW